MIPLTFGGSQGVSIEKLYSSSTPITPASLSARTSALRMSCSRSLTAVLSARSGSRLSALAAWTIARSRAPSCSSYSSWIGDETYSSSSPIF